MVIGDKKYIYSKGLAFYAELESQRLEKELANGWLIESINFLGWYKLKKVKKEEAHVVIDFFPDKKAELADYLEFYQASGWNKVASYRNRYFVFKAPINTESVYTDEESYTTRIKKESIWFMLNSLIVSVFGIIWLFLLNSQKFGIGFSKENFWYGFLQGIGVALLSFPLLILILIIYYKVVYLRRSSYFKKPENYAKKQRFIRDIFVTMLIGAIVGGLLGFLFGINSI